MELNGPVGILSGLAVIGFIVGGVVWDSKLTFTEAAALAVQHPAYSLPLGAVLLFLVLFGKGGAGDAV